MHARTVAAKAAAFVAAALLIGAALALVSSAVAPADGMQDLARITIAMLLAGGAGIVGAGALLLGRQALPGWLAGLAIAACVAGLLAGLRMLVTSTPGGLVFGAVFTLSAIAGLVAAGLTLRRRPTSGTRS